MKAVIISKRDCWVAGLCILLMLAIAVVAVTGVNQAISVASAERKIPIYCVSCEEKQIAISFDAAWGNEDTQTLIDILAEYQVPATFFVVGQWVDKYPESVKALADAGHDIENHSNTHPHMPQLSIGNLVTEINACNDKIERLTGIRPNLLRAPYGDYNNTLIETLDGLGMYCIQWDVDSLDWKELSADEITNRVTTRVQPGSIVLFHNAALHTPEALPGILKTLQGEGYTFVKINDLILKSNYTIDNTGRQCPS